MLLSFAEALLNDFDPAFLKDFKLINVLGCSLNKVSTIRYHLSRMLVSIYFSSISTGDKEISKKLIESNIQGSFSSCSCFLTQN